MIERNYEAEAKVLKTFEELIVILNGILQIHKDFIKEINKEEKKCLYCSPQCSLYGTEKCEEQNA